MNQVIYTLLRDDDFRERWHNDMREMWCRDINVMSICIAILLCFLAVAVVAYILARILSKKNNYGDEDVMGIRKGFGTHKTIAASTSADISVGSLYCMKHFQATEISKGK